MKDEEPVAVAIFSVSRDQWARFLGMMDDSATHFSNWESWRLEVDKLVFDMAKSGVEVVEIEADLDHFSAWCDKLGRARDGVSRSYYAGELLRSRDC